MVEIGRCDLFSPGELAGNHPIPDIGAKIVRVVVGGHRCESWGPKVGETAGYQFLDDDVEWKTVLIVFENSSRSMRYDAAVVGRGVERIRCHQRSMFGLGLSCHQAQYGVARTEPVIEHLPDVGRDRHLDAVLVG